MTDFERRQIGNMSLDELHGDPALLDPDVEPGTPSPATDLHRQGISYEVTAPVPSKKYSSEQLSAMGMVGVTLVIPAPESK